MRVFNFLAGFRERFFRWQPAFSWTVARYMQQVPTFVNCQSGAEAAGQASVTPRLPLHLLQTHWVTNQLINQSIKSLLLRSCGNEPDILWKLPLFVI